MRFPLDWLKEFVDVRVRPAKLADILTMSGLEVESLEEAGRTAIFEIGVTPNRADCLSVKGCAGEVAALTGGKLKQRKLKAPRGQGKMAGAAKVSVKSRARCPRYAARVIRGVKIGPSPQWLAARLAACGVRSINNVVDATNYVMIELGQPLHAFDLGRLAGRRIVVRVAKDGESFTTLDGVQRKMCSEDLMICDGERPVAVAGVMGGENSEVTDGTTDVLLESAYFEPTGVRRTSKRLGLATESSRRFERGVDPSGVVEALHRLAALIIEIAGGTPTTDWVDRYPKRIAARRLALAASEANRILGTDIEAAAMAKYLRRLGFGVTGPKGGRVSVTVPTGRPDITRPIDLIEEIARVHGYSKIAETMPAVPMKPIVRPRHSKYETAVRNAMIGSGLTEIVTYGFTSEEALEPFRSLSTEPIKVANPLSNENGVMITTLVPNVIQTVALNLMRQRTDARFFTLQRVYLRTKALDSVEEPRMVCGAITGHRYPGSWDRSKEMVDFYDVKIAVETAVDSLGLDDEVIYQRGPAPGFLHPGRFAYVLLGGSRMGYVGQIHPDLANRLDLTQDVYVFELDFEKLAERAQSEMPRYEEFSRFPFVTRDIAIVLDEQIPFYEVEKVISDGGVKILDDVELFDVFEGGALPKGARSLGIALRFSRGDRTLTDEEVNAAQERIVGDLSAKLGAELR